MIEMFLYLHRRMDYSRTPAIALLKVRNREIIEKQRDHAGAPHLDGSIKNVARLKKLIS